MSRLDGVPIVQRENDASKNCKMVVVTGVIILLIICVMFYQKNDQVYTYGNSEYIEPMMVVNHENSLNPVLGQFIQLINLDKDMIPVNKIVIIDKDRNMYPLSTKDAIYTKVRKTGSMWQYKLTKPVYITQIIIDLNMSDKRKENIVNTQVRIRDTEYDTLWTSNKRLHVESYVDVYVARPHYIYPIPQQVLDPDLSTYGQEVTLGYHLMSNTW